MLNPKRKCRTATDDAFKQTTVVGYGNTVDRPHTLASQLAVFRGALSLGVKLTAHIHLVPKLRKRGAIPLFLPYEGVSKSFRTESIMK